MFMDKRTVCFQMNVDDIKAVEKLAQKQERTLSAMLRILVRDHLKLLREQGLLE